VLWQALRALAGNGFGAVYKFALAVFACMGQTYGVQPREGGRGRAKVCAIGGVDAR
jgi:hypothetical protein